MPGIKPKNINGVWYAYGTFDGKRIRKSLGTRDEQAAKELCAHYEARLWKRRTYGEEAVRTFEEAAESYLLQGGEGRYLPKIIKYFKGRPIGSIKPAEVRHMAMHLYPTAQPSTKNRQAIIPARAVINHAHDLGWCGPMRVKQFDVPKSRKHKPVDRQWMEAFIAEADRSGLPHLSGLVLFMHTTASRVSEAINLLGHHIDLKSRTVVLEKTKTDEWVTKYLTAECVARIAALDPKKDERVFRYTDRQAVNRRIKAVARRAGIEERSSHSVGRHSFATNLINAGARVRDVMDAGNWKSPSLFMGTYVHSEEAGRTVTGIFDSQSGPIDIKLAEGVKSKRLRFGKQKRK